MAGDYAALLEQHRPVLRYDSQETYFADAASEWTDAPTNVLRRADGTVLAAAGCAGGSPKLSLGFLEPKTYADGAAVQRDDRIGHPAKDYVAASRLLHAESQYGNRMYGRWAGGSDGRVWLQFWFFYFYNDYNLIGPLIRAGLHEGDWEMVQLRLDATGTTPDLAVYAQHDAAQAKAWASVQKVGDRPVVYPARGSHASYFEADDAHWTGRWFDHADGRRRTPDLKLIEVVDGDPAFAWMRWPGRWGDTVPPTKLNPLDDSSPVGPGAHVQWNDPHALLLKARQHERFERPERGPAPVAPPAPTVTLTRAGAALAVGYTVASWPAGAGAAGPVGLVVTVNSPQEPLPPQAYRIPVGETAGTVEVPGLSLHADWSYDVTVSVADANGIASPSTTVELTAEPETAPALT